MKNLQPASFSSPPTDLAGWEKIFDAKAAELYPATDPSHDLLHIHRVVKAAKKIAAEEGASLDVVIPAAYFHDFVNVPKNDPRRSEASRLSGVAAVEYLKSIGYPEKHFDAIQHAIAAHSFSAQITPETLEAEVVQDADRLDSLGAIGIARCFCTNGIMATPFYCEGDLMAENHVPDDRKYAVDHFFIKLYKIAETLHTKAAKAEGARRVAFMKEYLKQMVTEADPV